MRREAQNILLLLVGGALLKITLDGTYLRYVKPTVKPWVIAAGVVMVGLAVIAIITDIRAARPASAEDAHGHARNARSPWLLVLPVLAIFLIAPPALGADSVLRSDGRTVAPVVPQGTSAFPPLPGDVVVPLDLSEFITRSVWDGTHALTGRTVALTGFVVQDHGSTYVARLVITCCAADATPMKVHLAGGQAAALPDDQWIVADGLLVPGSATAANEYIPTLNVRGITQISQPADPYEY